MKLYELTEVFNELQQKVEDGEIDRQTAYDTLQALDGAIEEKVHHTALFIRNLKAYAEVLKAEEERMADRRKSVEKSLEGARDYIEQQMAAVGKRRIKGALVTVTIQKKPASLDIASDAVIPPEFMIPQEPKVDRKGLLAAVKDGMQWEGITLKQGEGVRIR